MVDDSLRLLEELMEVCQGHKYNSRGVGGLPDFLLLITLSWIEANKALTLPNLFE